MFLTQPQTGGLESAATGTLLQYGVLGVVVLVLGWFALTTIRRERARADEMERWHRDTVMPTLSKAVDELGRLVDLMPELVAALGGRRRS